MQQRLTIVVLLAAALAHFSTAATAQSAGQSELKQIQLSEKQVQGVISAQKDVAAIFDKLQGPPPDELPAPILAELDAAANKTMPAPEKKQMLEELNEALKSAQPIQFPGNIELVKKYYDKINGALQ